MKRATLARIALLGAAVAVLTTDCATTLPLAPSGPLPMVPPVPPAAPVPEGDGTGLRVAIVGDSLTAGGGRLLSDGLNAKTWITYAQGDGVNYVGGWARGGSTVQDQAAAVRPIPDVDVLVLMSGTNDVRLGIGFAESRASYESIIRTIDAHQVVVAAIPPYDRKPQDALRYGAELGRWVGTTNHAFVDPWLDVRVGDTWREGESADGIHPTTSGYARLGQVLRDAILAAGSEIHAQESTE